MSNFWTGFEKRADGSDAPKTEAKSKKLLIAALAGVGLTGAAGLYGAHHLFKAVKALGKHGPGVPRRRPR